MRLSFGRHFLISVGIALWFTSCITTGNISVQVSAPAKRAIPGDIQSIALMNRSLSNDFDNLNQDSLETLFIKKRLHMDKIFLDTEACDSTLKALGNSLYESGRFDVVIPLRRNLPNNNHTYQDISPSLTLAQVKQICSEFNVDALLSLENFHEKVKTSYQTGYNYANAYTNYKEINAYVQVAFHSNWKLYQPKEQLMIAKFEVNDTIFWERNGVTLQETYEQLPTIKEALIDGAIENGENFAAYISPYWKNEERKYFITNRPEIDLAVTKLLKNDWGEAEKIWLKYSNVSPVGLRSKIEYNLALASEMNGNLKEAIQWAKKSGQSKYSKTAEDFLLLLNSRLAEN